MVNGDGQNPQHEIPERIGSYRVLERLGRGGMGEVLLVYDDRLERHVAVKRVRRVNGSGDTDQIRFLREARAAARLNHPSIVQVYDVLEDDWGLNIVMEYVEGRTVAELTREGELTLEKVLFLGWEIAEALAEAHGAGIVHRDLKGENVIVTTSGHAKILDFGLAKQLEVDDESLTATGQVLGTWRSMSPEQARGEKVDHRTDLFSLGVLLYEMLSGRSPFRGSNVLQTLNNVQREKPFPLNQLDPNIDLELSNLVDWLLQKDPRNRPSTARQVAQVLQRISMSLDAVTAGRSIPPMDRRNRQATMVAETLASTGFSARPLDSVTEPPTANYFSSLSQTPALEKTPPLKRYRWIVLVSVLLVLGAVFWWRAPRGEPRRIAVTDPEVSGAGSDAALLTAGVREATLSTLISLKGLSVLEPGLVGERGGDPSGLALAVGADELFNTTIEHGSEAARVTLSRVDGETGALIWRQQFDVPSGLSDGLLAAEAVGAHIRRGYPDYRTLAGTPKLEARDEDYADFLRLLRDFETSRTTRFAEKRGEIESILKGSPNFFAAYLMAGANALTDYRNSGDLELLNMAVRYRDQAQKIAPEDIRFLRLDFTVALAQNNFERADEVLTHLERLQPRAVQTLQLQSQLAERRGDLTGAVGIMREVAARRPHWRALYRLSKLENQTGQVDAARDHLKQLLKIAPDNLWGMVGLANSEMMFGDMAQAEKLFGKVVERNPHKSFYANLGAARFWLGDYEGAETAYQAALELAPEDATTMLGLADVKMAGGDHEAARALYGDALEKLERKASEAGLEPIEALVKAQCLAYLGRLEEAVALTLMTLQQNPDHAEVAYQAALVYALAGETRSVLACTKTALEKGIQPRWFAIPAFASMRSEPKFQALVGDGQTP